ncbi:MAG: YcgL domain-containing protein [Glaciecola sp.]
MKLSAVYKSPKKADTYLYLEKRDDFSKVPEALLTHFGTPKFVTLVPIGKHDKIANIETHTFIEKVRNDGFYLQLPPKEKSLLEIHRQDLGLDTNKQSHNE